MGESIPLYGLRVGDVLQGANLKVATSKVKDGATEFISASGEVLIFSGNSEHVYSNEMNEYSASLKAAGRWPAIEGSLALSGYYGSFKSAADRDLHMTVHAIKWTGIESIPLHKLTMGGLVSLLEPNCKHAVVSLLDEYAKLQDDFVNVDEKTILSDPKKQARAREYGKKVNEFLNKFGDGIVVRILWGGYAVLDLAIHFRDTEERTRVGAEGEITVATPAFTGSVSAAWGKKGSLVQGSATAKLTHSVWGSCMDGLVSSWDQKFSEAATKIGTFKDVDVFPSTILKQKPPTPTLPAFQPTTAQKIKDMGVDGLKAISIAREYERYLADCKAKGTTPTRKLDDFIADFQAKAEEPKLPEISVEKILPNKAAVNAINRGGAADNLGANAAVNLGADRPPPVLANDGQPAPGNDPRAAYTPIGVWVMRWGQVFPWITTATKNALPPPDDASWDPVRYRILLQDLLSLERIYRRMAGSEVKIGAFQKDNGLGGIADQFANATSTLMEWGVSGKFPSKASLPLGDAAWKILRHWDKLGHIFRAAHLGFAVYSNWHRGRGSNADHYVFTKTGPYTQGDWAMLTGRSVDFNGDNYSVFKETMKALPLIIPDVVPGADPWVFCFICTGGTSTLNGKQLAYDGVLTVSTWNLPYNSAVHALTRLVPKEVLADWFRFDPVSVGGKIKIPCFLAKTPTNWQAVDNFDGNTCVVMLPIPYSAALGLDGWKGTTVATGVSGIEGSLSKLKENMANLPLWTSDSDGWSGKQVDPDESYNVNIMDDVLYLGLVDKP
jgi:hypothetical protein